MKFHTLLVDPPWEYRVWTAKGGHKSASAHYDTQTSSWVENLPVAQVCKPDCCLFLWATWPTLPDALKVIEAWGFTYKTLGFDWIKLVKSQTPRMGLGYWTRSNSEPCLFATRGKPQRLDKGVSQIIECGIGRHSEKPLETYERIERLVAGPYLEMFARPEGGLLPQRDGWTRIGNEITGRDICEDLALLAEQGGENPAR